MARMNGKAKRKRGGFDPNPGRPNKLIKTEPKGLRVIYEKLGNTEIGEFLPALHSLGALAADGSDSASAILQFGENKQLVVQLLPFLNHTNPSVQLAAAGALRNLSSCGNEQHIEQLLKCGALQHLCTLLSKKCNATDTVELHEQHAVLEQAAYILYNICELNAEATEEASESAVSALLQHVHTEQSTLPPTTCLAVHTALLCLTENNPQACAAVEPYSGQLESIIKNHTSDEESDGVSLHDAVIVAGILTNLGKCGAHSQTLVPVLRILAISTRFTPATLLHKHVVLPSPLTTPTHSPRPLDDEVAASPSTALANLDRINLQAATNGDHARVQEEGMDDQEEEGTAQSTAATKELVMHLQHHAENKDGVANQDTGALTTAAWTKVQHHLGALQVTLELLNNLCCGDDDESCDEASGSLKKQGLVKWNEDNDMEDEEDDQWEQADDETDMVELLQPLLQEHSFFESLLDILQPVAPAVLQALQGSKFESQLQTLLSGVRSRGLATLQALLECHNITQLGGAAKLFQCWTDIARLAFKEQKFEGEDELEGATGALRAIIAKFSPEDSHHLAAITQEDLKVLLSAGRSCGGAGARRNLSRLVGQLGCLLLARSSPSSLLQEPVKGIMLEATDYLLLLAGNDTSLVVSAEALDVVMDLYAEDNTDRLALETRLIDRLPQILDYFNARYKKARRDEAIMQHRVLFVTVKENLPEFIKYKAPRVKNVDSEKKHAKKEQTVGGKVKGKAAGETNKSSKRERRK